MTVRLTRAAKADLGEITDYLRAENPHAARRVLAGLRATMGLLRAVPGMGAPFAERPGVRVAVHKRYLIVYRERRGGGVIVVRVFHGARDWRSLL